MVEPLVLDVVLRDSVSLPLGKVTTHHYSVMLFCFIFFISLNQHLELF